jgi:uncharacterized membrane protein
MLKSSIFKALAMSLCIVSAGAQAQSKLSITNLAFLTPQGSAEWSGINNAGAIVGTINGQLSVFSNGALTKYTIPDFHGSNIFIGNSGAIVYTEFNDPWSFAMTESFVYQNGVAKRITPLYESVYRGGTYAKAINDAGVVVGTGSHYRGDCPGDPGCERFSPWDRAIYHKNGKTFDLGTMGGNRANATDINNQGVVVGSSYGPDVTGDTFVYYDGAMHVLGRSSTTPVQINDAAQILGTSRVKDGEWTYHTESWIYDQGEIATIGLAGASNIAVDLNNAGQVVGKTEQGGHYWFYTDGKTIDLNTLLYEDDWTITGVIDLNDAGQILATATREGRGTSYVLLTPDMAPVLLPAGMPPVLPTAPVPEPGTYAMLVGGLGVLAAWRRRRQA